MLYCVAHDNGLGSVFVFREGASAILFFFIISFLNEIYNINNMLSSSLNLIAFIGRVPTYCIGN